MSDRASLRSAITRFGLVQVMACHSPLSALLAEEAGFDGLWASGFEFSALMGLPDASLVSMTQHLEMMRAIADRIRIPIVADIDTGFGNAINVMHAVRQYEAAGAAAVVIEDKVFPKTTSLLDGSRQELVSIEEFQGKIAAALDARRSDDFVIVARTEALISGAGLEAALDRAREYQRAGADLILVHSKQKSPDEIESFVRSWDGTAGIVIVPTAYPQMTVKRIWALEKIKVVIYGNHAIRAAIGAMQATFARIMAEGGIEGVDRDISPVKEVFRLQDLEAIQRSEQAFLR